MQKKTLTVACSTVLGLISGTGYVYAQECEVTDDAVLDLSNRRCATLSATNGGRAIGEHVGITGTGNWDDVWVSGGGEWTWKTQASPAASR